jgi:hypothetical protein
MCCFTQEPYSSIYPVHVSHMIQYQGLTMADDIDEQATAHIREILRLVLDVKGKTLRKLNEVVGQTSKFAFNLSYMYMLRL